MKPNDETREIRDLLAGRAPTAGEEPTGANALWSSLELPEPQPAPPGFSRRVTARAIGERGATLGLPLAPGLARAAAALAVVVGIAGGAGFGLLALSPDEIESELAWSSESFAEEVVDGLTSVAVSTSDDEARR